VDSGRIRRIVEKAIIRKAYSMYRIALAYRHPITGLLYTSYLITRRFSVVRGSPRLWRISGGLKTLAYLSSRRPLDLAILSTALATRKVVDMRRVEKVSKFVRLERELTHNIASSKLSFDQKLYMFRNLYEGRVFGIPFSIKGLRDFAKLYDEYLRRIDNAVIGFDREEARRILDEIRDSVSMDWAKPYIKAVLDGDIHARYGYIVERFERSLPNIPDIKLDLLDDFRRSYVLGLSKAVEVSDRDVGYALMKCQQGENYPYYLGVLKGYYILKGLEYEFYAIESKLEGSYIGFSAVFGEAVEVEETREEGERKVEEVREEDLLLEAVMEAVTEQMKVVDECIDSLKRLEREYVRYKDYLAEVSEEVFSFRYYGLQHRYDLLSREDAENAMRVLEQLIEYRGKISEIRDAYRLTYDRGYAYVPDEAKSEYSKFKEVLMDMENTIQLLDILISDLTRILGDLGYEV